MVRLVRALAHLNSPSNRDLVVQPTGCGLDDLRPAVLLFHDAAETVGDARLQVSATEAGGKPVFVGVARAADVDRYLAGVATDRVTDVDVLPFGIDRQRRAGRAAAFGTPGTQRFWVAHAGSAEDGTARLDWKVRDGRYRVVVMNADGTPGVATRSELAVEVPHGTAIGVGVLVAGMLLGGLGLAGLAFGLRRNPPG